MLLNRMWLSIVRVASLAVLLLTMPTAYAIGLGSIQLNSYLHQPFKATVEIYNTGKFNQEDLFIELVSFDKDSFSQPDIENELYKRKVKFSVELLGNEKGLLHISTQRALKEPYVHFKLSVQTPKSRAMKEYTLLLDPFVPSGDGEH